MGEIDPAETAQARALLADWFSARRGQNEQPYSAGAFADWQVGRWEEFFVFGSPDGYTSQLFLVGDGVVRPFSYADESAESALASARAERDGLITPDPPQRSPF